VAKPKKSKAAKHKPESGVSPAPEKEDEEADDEASEEVMVVEVTWMQPYLAYMMNKELPENQVEARRIAHRSKAFRVVNGKLYKRSISGVIQRCVTLEEGHIILKDIHGGICGHHASSRAIAAKAFRAGFLLAYRKT
jgi:hypothetical protein